MCLCISTRVLQEPVCRVRFFDMIDLEECPCEEGLPVMEGIEDISGEERDIKVEAKMGGRNKMTQHSLIHIGPC